MITALDTNVIVALWDEDRSLRSAAQLVLDNALGRRALVVCAAVFAGSKSVVDCFFGDTDILIDWNLSEAIYHAAGQSFQKYAASKTATAARP